MLARLANVAQISWLEDDAAAPPHALNLIGELKVMVPLAGLIDVGAETARLTKQLEQTRGDLERVDKKLGNESFVAKAPADVVDKERAKRADLEERVRTLEGQLEELQSLQ